MKIEVGKQYRLKNGKKAIILSDIGGEYFPFIGAYESDVEGMDAGAWNENGDFNYTDDKLQGLGIYVEWDEPKRKLVAWIHPDGGVPQFRPEGEDLPFTGFMRAPWLDQRDK